VSSAVGRLVRLGFSTALVLSAVVSLASAATIRCVPAERPIAVEVEGAIGGAGTELEPGDPAWARVLAVFVEQGGVGAVPPMSGTWSVRAGGRLRFEPRFPLARGVRYRAEFHAPTGAPLISFFELPAGSQQPTTVVCQLYPTAAELPENQLKFYLYFSAPMRRGDIYRHIQIRDATGSVIDLAFLELEEELWDPTMTRLTLLIDPGRIKRGVKPLEDIGPVFDAGKNYSLKIAPEMRDAEGRPLRATHEKKFRIGAADRTAVDPAKWQLTPPAAGTRAALVVAFGEPMEHALTSRMLEVWLPDGAEIKGEVTLGAEERSWSFVPATPWRAGAHRLVIATTIEDLAGNNIGKVFDVALFEGAQRRVERPTVEVGFAIK
jgi:hypothetical protein